MLYLYIGYIVLWKKIDNKYPFSLPKLKKYMVYYKLKVYIKDHIMKEIKLKNNMFT